MRGLAARSLIVTVILTLSLGGALTATAQDESLSGKATNWIGSPPPADCKVEPTTAEKITAALTERAKAPADPTALPLQVAAETDLPTGEPVDAEILDAVSATLWELTACLNGGDFASFLALFSPTGIYQFFSSLLGALGRAPGPLTDKEIADMGANMATSLTAAPTPSPEEESGKIDKIRDARTLPDKRVLIVLDGNISGDGSAFALLGKSDDRWLIDAIGVIGELLPAASE